MKKNWFDSKVKEFSSIGGYQKPQLNENSLKLDSNENYVLSKQFQNDIVSAARKNSDVREYPLGGVESQISSTIKIWDKSAVFDIWIEFICWYFIPSFM